MRRSGFVLPGLSMGLLYSSIYVGLIIINLRGSASDGKGDFGVLLHFALIALAASGLSFAARKGIGRLRPLAALLALAGLFLMVLPFLPGDMTERIFNARPPVLAMGMAFFMPVALFLFFRTAPTGRAGSYFARVIAGSELLWALLFPLLGGVSPQLPGQQAFHLFSLCCWMVGGAGLCLGAALNRAARESAAVAPDASMRSGAFQRMDFAPKARKTALFAEEAHSYGARPEQKGPLDKAVGQKTRLALCLILAAGVGVFTMMGLHMGMLMPKTAVMPELIGIVHFVYLLLLPLVGKMLDENPGTLMGMGILGLAAVFLLGFFHENGLIGRMPLFYTLNFMQSILLLTAYTATAGLLKTHAAFPLLITLPHGLYMAHTGGVTLRGLVEAVPYGITAASLPLALGTAFCLWRFRSLLAKEPELWVLPLTENTAAPVSEPAAEPSALHPALHPGHIAAFAATHGLSKQEIRVMEMLAQDRSTEEIATVLAVKTSSVRTYIVRLMNKTDSNNRAELMARYAAQSPAPRKTHSD